MFLKYRKFLSLFLALLIALPWNVSISFAADYDTGTLSHYNGIIFGDMTALQADTEGALAVGGNADFGSPGQGYDVAGAHSDVHNGEYSHIGLYDNPKGYPSFLLGGQLAVKGHRASVSCGITLMKESKKAASQDALAKLESLTGIEFTTDETIDAFFAAATAKVAATVKNLSKSGLETLSVDELRKLSGQDISRFANHGLAESGLNILILDVTVENDTFHSSSISFPDLSAYDIAVINIPAKRVDFTGGSISYKGSTVLTDPRAYPTNAPLSELAQIVVWNLPNAREVNVTSYDVVGSVLAPNAAVTGTGGSINGMLVADSFYQQSSMELHAFRISNEIWNLEPQEPEPEEPDEPKPPIKAVSEDSDAGLNGAVVEVDDQITYEISYYNHEIDPVTVSIFDQLDAGVDFGFASHDGSYSEEDHEVTWVIEDVAPKTHGSVTLTVTVNEKALLDDAGDPCDDPEISNKAGVKIGNNARQETDRVPNPLEPEKPNPPEPPEPPEPPGPEEPDEPEPPVKEVSEDSDAGLDGAVVEVDDQITYEISYYNHEIDPVTVSIFDQLDPGVDFSSASHDGSYSEEDHEVTWVIEDVAPKTHGSVTLTVTVNEKALLDEAGDPCDDPEVSNKAGVKIGNNARQETDRVPNPLEPEKPNPPEPPEPPEPPGPEEPDPEKPVKRIADNSPSGAGGSKVKVGDIIIYEIKYFCKASREGDVDDAGSKLDALSDAADDDRAAEEDSRSENEEQQSSGGEADSENDPKNDADSEAGGDMEHSDGSHAGSPPEDSSELDGSSPRDPLLPFSHAARETEMSAETLPPGEPLGEEGTSGEAASAQPLPSQSTPYQPQSEGLPLPSADQNASDEGEPEGLVTITIRDVLDAGLDFLEASHDGSYDGESRTVTWILTEVTPGTEGSVFLTVKVNENALTSSLVENTAWVQVGHDPEQETDKVVNPVDEEEDPDDPDDRGRRRRNRGSGPDPDEPEEPQNPESEDPEEDDPPEGVKSDVEEPDEDEPVEGPANEDVPASAPSAAKINPKTGVTPSLLLQGLMLLFLYLTLALTGKPRK